MIVKLESREFFQDDVVMTWRVTKGLNEYIIEKWYCGGIDEDGNEDLQGSCFCDISVFEIIAGNHDVVEKIAKEYDGEITEEEVYITFPDVKWNVCVRNEQSYDDTSRIFDEFVKIIEEIG